MQCDENYYQPFKYSSSYGNTCVFLKSVCNDVGQIESTDRRTTSDITCRCDYRFGYSFVINPKTPCFCAPSEEDCSCYYKECGREQVLTPGKHYSNVYPYFYTQTHSVFLMKICWVVVKRYSQCLFKKLL